MNKTTWKNRILSLLLAVFMTVGVFPVQAFAEDGGDSIVLETREIQAQIIEEGADPASLIKTLAPVRSGPKKAPAVKTDSKDAVSLSGNDAKTDKDEPETDDPEPVVAPAPENDSEQVVLSGLLPQDGIVTASSVSPVLDDLSPIAAYDIKIYADSSRLAAGSSWQPVSPIRVRIQNDAFAGYTGDLYIYHIADGSSAPEFVATVPVSGSAVEFDAASFSVYVVTPDTYTRTYKFYALNEYGDYEEYGFDTESGSSAFAQIIKNGETPVVPAAPANPQDPTATFAGWYQDVTPPGETTQVFASDPYDFNNIPDITVTEEVHLYAKYYSYAYVIFHDHQPSSADPYPVVFTERTLLEGGSADLDISGKKVVYSVDNSKVFYGWSRTKIDNHDSGYDVEHHAVVKEPDTITVTGTTHLYPIFKTVYWLSFDSGPSGSGATYYPETSYFGGEGPSTLADHVPTRDGNYVFDGWYTAKNGGGTKIANADGSLIANASASGISVNSEGNALTLTANVMLYAHWTAPTTANYTVVIVKQKATDAESLPDNQKTYEFSESFVLAGTIGDTVTADADYKALDTDAAYNALHSGANVSGESNPYYGYTYNAVNSTENVTIASDGSSVLYVRYDWTTPPDMTDKSFTLTFADSLETPGEASTDLPVAYDQASGDNAKVAYNVSLGSLVPADPVSGRDGYEFAGWYADKACTTRAFFADDTSYQNYTGSKALFTTMPGTDITFYAGWQLKWYIVTIDPDYGAMYSYDGGHNLVGTGSTWFWVAYGGKVQEYTTVTRDYIESDSGTWYYVHHSGDGLGGTQWPNRYTYYTQDPSEATEFTTFEYRPGVYRYDGWYEVKSDGTEVPYDFNRGVEDNITIRLHWTKMGDFYLSYVAGDGTLNGEDELETVYVDLDNGSYADNAQVVVTRTAVAPEGYEFAGWTIRGDSSGTIYRPGSSFTLLTSYAATVQGKQTVYLEAVYTRVPMASIVYDANGGIIEPAYLDYGYPADSTAPQAETSYDAAAGTATISDLVNNSQIYLSDGSGFSRANATFAGWCNKPVYDPGDSEAILFLPGTQSTETYNVDTHEPYTLYAVWQVEVRFHLNETPSNASFGDTDWDSAVYTKNTDNASDHYYTQYVYLSNAVDCPAYTPLYTGSGSKTFRYWAEKDAGDNLVQYDFSQTVSAELDLYAYWDAPVTLPVHAVDASDQTIVDKDSAWGASGKSITVGVDPITIDAAKAAEYVTGLPSGYEFAFANIHDGAVQDIREEHITSIYYRVSDGEIIVCYEGGDESTLTAGEELYFVYYQTKTLNIGYVEAQTGGTLVPVTVDSAAPAVTGAALGSYDLTASLNTPLTYPAASGTYSYYSYAIGPSGAANTAEFIALTAESDSESSRPALQVRNTWRGFEYSEDGGTSWESCGYEPALYIVYYPSRPIIITVSEKTIGFSADMNTDFSYTVDVVEAGNGSVFNGTGTLKNGESKHMTLYHTTDHEQTITVVQDENTAFVTTASVTTAPESSNKGTVDNSTRTWTYTTDGSYESLEVEFTNSRDSVGIEVHVASVDVVNGSINFSDSWRSDDSTKYSFDIARGESAVFTAKLPADSIIKTGHEAYAMGAIFYGTDNGSAVTPAGELTVYRIAYEPSSEGSNVYTLYLYEENGYQIIDLKNTDHPEYNIYYLYYPMLTIHYMKETSGGAIAPIEGAVSGKITYSGSELTMNGAVVSQNQKVLIPADGLSIRQSVEPGSFNLPPLLDDGSNQHDLIISKVAPYSAADPTVPVTNVSTFGDDVTEDINVYLNIIDNKLEWCFGDFNWSEFTNWPVIYAIYRERGYDLIVSKTVTVDTGCRDPFTVTISSTAINRSSYDVEGTGSSKITATPANGSTPGTISFKVVDGSSVKIIGLSAGSYTIEETANDNYTLSVKKNSTDDLTVTGNRTATFDLSAETKVDLINVPQHICQVGHRQFYTIQSAVDWIEGNAADFTGTIEMLVDYIMPSSDSVEIADYLNITLTSAAGTNTITRKWNFTDEPMFTNSGSFTLQNITLDGNNVAASEAMIGNEGTLTIDSGATLTNGSNSGNGGAVNSWNGSVTVGTGAVISNSSASNGGAIYASGGTVTVNDGLINGNSAANGAAVYYAGSENVTITGGTISENSASSNGGAVYMSTGTLNVSGGTIIKSSAASGGAFYAANAVVNISGGTIGSDGNGNTAARGGAVYAEAGSVTVSGGTLSYNHADTSGGAVYVNTATVSMSGGSLAHNSADVNGGGIFSGAGAVTVENGTIDSNTAGANGGGIYASSGAVTLSGTKSGSTFNILFTGNTAAKGGAVYTDTSALSADTVKFDSNSAAGNGGALWINSGSATFTNTEMTANSAVNGAAAFTNTGTITFSAGNVKNNTASSGGAVGVGSATARLNFSGNVQITGNTMGSDPSNVYLDQDTDAVINATGLDSSAAIGIYVAGDVTADLFMNRGVPSGVFGTYTSDSNVGKFTNDRLPGLSVQKNTSAKKLYWGKAFAVEVRYLESYASGFPPTAAGTSKYTNNDYYAPAGLNAASEIAASLQDKSGSTTAVFAHAFVQGASSFDDYITDVNWDSSANSWKFVKRDGTSVPASKLIIYFAEPSYISIENNSPDTLTINTLTVAGQNAINSNSQAGYGYIFAVNGVIMDELYPVTAADLTLDAGKSIKLLFPGGKNTAYTLNGSFVGAARDITYTLTDGSGNPYTLAQADTASFSLPLSGQPNKTLNSNGGTFEIIFGGSKPICKIVTGDVGSLSAGEIAGRTNTPNGDGNYEYTFSTLNQAKAFITAHMSVDKTATIEMLVDYLIPNSDAVVLPAGYDITFTTATTGEYKYSDNSSARATISRDQGNNKSFIGTETGELVSGDYNSKLTVKNLIFDGKAFGGESIEGGVIKTKGWNVEVDTVDFKNCQARYGGGIFIESVWPKKDDQTPYGYLTVSNSNFTNCMSLEGTDKFGGGGIWTSMKEMTITGCNFDSCEGAATIGKDKNAQGGAVFHFVANINASIETSSTVKNCTFNNCSANAAGSIECGARTVSVTGCIFRNSTAKTKNGGALNIWVYDSGTPTNDSWVYVKDCTFENCYCLNASGNSGNGGAFRSTAKYNTVTNCTFVNTKGNDGGAINIFNTNAADTTISGCSFDSCEATSEGGAVYCASKTLTVDNYTNPVTGVTTDTTISNCYSKDAGGGIFHNKSANGTSLSISNTTIDNCKSTAKAGGGVYSVAQIISLTDVTVNACTSAQQGGGLCLVPGNGAVSSCTVTTSIISGNSATGNGGGLYYSKNNGTLTFSNSTLSGNTSGGMGGGVYTNAPALTFTGSNIKENTAAGNGGGICHDNSSNLLTIDDGATVTGNTSGGMGGGVYTKANLALSNVTVTGNKLSHNTADSAAGVYMPNGKTLTAGKAKPDGYIGDWKDTITIKDNLTEDGTPSDLRLPMSSSVNSNSVSVLCDLKGEVRVVNAKVKGTQFGSSPIAYVGGFSDLNHVFIADDDSLYGIVDRADTAHKKIIWGTEPICKITDDRGRLLYLRMDESAYPAVFDYLDRDNKINPNDVSAFGIIRGHDPANSNVKLFNADGTPYTGTTYQVKMLVENYTANSAINTPNDTGKTIILTTAGSSDSLYPYRGRTGTRSVVMRGSHNLAMLTARCNINLLNIVLDGGSEAGAAVGKDTRILLDITEGTTIRLGKNSALQNAKISGDAYGAGARLENGASMVIEGGSIRNCTTAKSGGGIQVKNGNLTITAGSITRCSAAENGGGVYFENGTFIMSGGSITRCSAATGAGVFIAAGKSMTMSGGSISGNEATSAGGGIAVGSGASRLYFSGAAYVYGNTLKDENTLDVEACNVQMNQHFDYDAITQPHAADTTVIVSKGLIRGAAIGVYVPDGTNLYNKHGDLQMPFATYMPGTSNQTLNYFINDRNALKGGLYDDQAADNYMIYWVKIYSIKVNKVVMSDDPADAEKDFNFTLQLTGDASGILPDQIDGLYGDMLFDDGVATFSLKSGESITAEKLLFGFGYTVTENLSPAEQLYYKTSPGLVYNGQMDSETKYLYEVTFNNLHAVCKVTDSTEGLLYIRKSGVLQPAVFSQLQNAFNALRSTEFFSENGTAVAVNGGSTSVEMLVDYALEAASTFQDDTKAVLTTAEKNAADGYSYVGDGTTAKITRVFNGESMISVEGDLTLGNINLDGGSTVAAVEGGPFTSTADGGVIAVQADGKLTVGTGTTIQNSGTSGNGAGIWLAEGALMNISGAPVFSNNISTGVTLPSGAKNGGAAYTEAKQDIYIAGYGSADAASLAVTGNITSPAGSIWVWADQNRHYKESNQFAVMTGGIYTGLNAFRNARTDTETGNKLTTTPKYLYGVSRGSDGKVYWAGTRELAITKTVTGEFSIRTDEFDFTVSGLKKDEVYQYKRYTSTNGSTWTMASSGTFTGNSAGKVTFKLSHYQKIVIYVPTAYNVVVSENNGDYVPSYKIGTGSSVDGSTTTTIQMTNNAAVAFTNTMNAVAPTDYHTDVRPFALMLGIGAAMALMAFARRMPVFAAGGTGRGKVRGKAKHVGGPKHAKQIWRHGV